MVASSVVRRGFLVSVSSSGKEPFSLHVNKRLANPPKAKRGNLREGASGYSFHWLATWSLALARPESRTSVVELSAVHGGIEASKQRYVMNAGVLGRRNSWTNRNAVVPTRLGQKNLSSRPASQRRDS